MNVVGFDVPAFNSSKQRCIKRAFLERNLVLPFFGRYRGVTVIKAFRSTLHQSSWNVHITDYIPAFKQPVLNSSKQTSNTQEIFKRCIGLSHSLITQSQFNKEIDLKAWSLNVLEMLVHPVRDNISFIIQCVNDTGLWKTSFIFRHRKNWLGAFRQFDMWWIDCCRR